MTKALGWVGIGIVFLVGCSSSGSKSMGTGGTSGGGSGGGGSGGMGGVHAGSPIRQKRCATVAAGNRATLAKDHASITSL